MLLSVFANLFAVIAGYIFNDLEDASEDLINPYKSQRNVIAAGKLAESYGYTLSALAAGGSLAFATFVGSQAVIYALAALLALFLYSWRKVRLKSHAGADIMVHGGTAGLLFLAAFLPNHSGGPVNADVVLVALSLSIGWALSLVHHQLLDIDHDRAVTLCTTTVLLGKRGSLYLAYGLVVMLVILILILIAMGSLPVVPLLTFVSVSAAVLVPLLWFTRKDRTRAQIEWSQRLAFNAGGIVAIVVWLSFY